MGKKRNSLGSFYYRSISTLQLQKTTKKPWIGFLCRQNYGVWDFDINLQKYLKISLGPPKFFLSFNLVLNKQTNFSLQIEILLEGS